MKAHASVADALVAETKARNRLHVEYLLERALKQQRKKPGDHVLGNAIVQAEEFLRQGDHDNADSTEKPSAGADRNLKESMQKNKKNLQKFYIKIV